jgi:uncharacterized protein
MIATVVNCISVVIGSLIGLLLHKKITEEFKTVVYTSVGLISLVIGMSMALESGRVLYLALSLVVGGLFGSWWDVEGGILRFGEFLKRRVRAGDSRRDFAHGFLNASVLFCVGAMTLVGSFKAGAEGDYTLILTKSVMDGFMAILLTAAMGIGVGFSVITIFVYQGGLTLLSQYLRPVVNDLLLSELTGVGGVLVIMIGFNLLALREIKTANYLPALLLVIALVAMDPLFAAVSPT